MRTADGGETWQDITPPDGTAQAFRDIDAFDPNHAVVLASFTGNDGTGSEGPSRISRTADRGQTWQQEFNAIKADFPTSLAFFNHRRGLAVSETVG